MDNYDRRQLGDLARGCLSWRPPTEEDARRLAHGVIDLLVFLAAVERGAAPAPAWDIAADLAEARAEIADLRDELARYRRDLAHALAALDKAAP